MIRASGPYKDIAWSNIPEDIEHYVSRMRDAT